MAKTPARLAKYMDNPMEPATDPKACILDMRGLEHSRSRGCHKEECHRG